jgi:hypothetical protein
MEMAALSLICSATKVVPMLGIVDAKTVTSSLDIYSDGSASAEGFPGIRFDGALKAKYFDETVVVAGAQTDDGVETWVNLEPDGRDYSLSWLIYDHQAVDGRQTVTEIVNAKCKPAETLERVAQ